MFIKYLIVFIIYNNFFRNIVIANEGKKVVCYHSSWSNNRKSLGKFDITDNMDPFLCTHLIYAFYGIETTGELRIKEKHLGLGVNSGLLNLQKFNDIKLKNPALKTLLSVGGWSEGSKNFSIVAADPHKRITFLNFTTDFLKRHNFNGLDLDWEYPNERHNLENNDVENFIVWLKELKAGFQPYGFLLTAAVKAVGYKAEKSYNITEMVKYLDFVNVMAYALNGIWSPGVGINAPLYAGPTDQTERAKQHNFDYIAKFWVQQGVPRHKIVMGVPFYGRSFTLENPNNHSIGAKHSGPGIGGPYTKKAGIFGYNELCEQFLKEESLWHLEWETNQMVPYAYQDLQWIGYDNERSIALKVNYVNRENLGGIMVWTVDLDDFRGVCGGKRFPLLTIINEGIFMKENKNFSIAANFSET